MFLSLSAPGGWFNLFVKPQFWELDCNVFVRRTEQLRSGFHPIAFVFV